MVETRSDYASVPQDEINESATSDNRGEIQPVVRWSITIILVCTILDSILLSYLAFWYGKAALFPARRTAETSTLSSTYIDFDVLYKNKSRPSSPHGPIIDLPWAFTQVSSAEPGKVFPQWADSWTTEHGMVPINAYRLFVTPQTSTIAQFRVIDYGMENCTLALAIPPHAHSGFVISDLEEDFSHVDVWALSSIDKLDLRHLSWNTKPARTAYLGTLAAAYGSTRYLPSFLCPTGSYQTFELSCLKADCHVDVTNLERRAFGLYMLQHQTI